ncbi:MAG: FAD-dependent oxidoreductase, partial [Clostridiales bacterium]
MKSIWQKEMDIPARPRLDGDISADIAIIGAGMAGILTGYFLQKQGFDVVILEAKT